MLYSLGYFWVSSREVRHKLHFGLLVSMRISSLKKSWLNTLELKIQSENSNKPHESEEQEAYRRMRMVVKSEEKLSTIWDMLMKPASLKIWKTNKNWKIIRSGSHMAKVEQYLGTQLIHKWDKIKKSQKVFLWTLLRKPKQRTWRNILARNLKKKGSTWSPWLDCLDLSPTE